MASTKNYVILMFSDVISMNHNVKIVHSPHCKSKISIRYSVLFRFITIATAVQIA